MQCPLWFRDALHSSCFSRVFSDCMICILRLRTMFVYLRPALSSALQSTKCLSPALLYLQSMSQCSIATSPPPRCPTLSSNILARRLTSRTKIMSRRFKLLTYILLRLPNRLLARSHASIDCLLTSSPASPHRLFSSYSAFPNCLFPSPAAPYRLLVLFPLLFSLCLRLGPELL